MNISFSNAINTKDFAYGYLYDPQIISLSAKANAKPTINFMKQIQVDLQQHEGLLNDIAQEKKRATKLLSVNDDVDYQDNIKSIYAQRIARKKQLYNFYALSFLSHMNNILYSVYDQKGVLTGLSNATGETAIELVNNAVEISGITAKDAYQQCKKIFQPLLTYLKQSIEDEYPVNNIEKLQK